MRKPRLPQLYAQHWAALFIVLGIVVLVSGYINLYCTDLCASLPASPSWFTNLVKDHYANLAWTLIGTAVAVLVIDRANEQRTEEQQKAQLIRDMGHPSDNGIALRAARELKARQWLADGSLRGAHLWGANLEDADLFKADLRDSELSFTNLRGAVLSYAQLQGAYISQAIFFEAYLPEANLQGIKGTDLDGVYFINQFLTCRVMRGVTMPHGRRYDGRFNLEFDLFESKHKGIDASDSEAMAAFYGVTREQYELGQEWYLENWERNRVEINEQREKLGLELLNE